MMEGRRRGRLVCLISVVVEEEDGDDGDDGSATELTGH